MSAASCACESSIGVRVAIIARRARREGLRVSSVFAVSPRRGKIPAYAFYAGIQARVRHGIDRKSNMEAALVGARAVDSTPMLVAMPATTIWVV